MNSTAQWPKLIPQLTPEQKRISDDFMRHWHEELPKRYGIVDDFNHNYVVRHAPATFKSTLEIGAGLGEHLAYEKLNGEQQRNYVALEMRENMAARIRERFPLVQTYVGDCQEKLDFPEGHFDRIIAVHVLEHLPNLPATIREMHRLCHPGHGAFSIVIPCEGGLAYTLARRISAQRIFEKRYQQPYDWFIKREHINLPAEIITELEKYFTPVHRSFFPLLVPIVTCNLCIGLTLRPKTS
ncbi:MAG TPA: class I SAM-dependent methyltransferase [Verrucomicrobiae bacterium]|jgi:SAM-dependent methyltransferase